MNSMITFPPSEPILKLPRQSAEKWAATLAEERRRLHEDQEALHEREQNLRDYEARLRSLQADIEAGRSTQANGHIVPGTASRSGTPTPFLRPSSHAPFVDDPALQAAWDKLHRAREILEAEQKNLRDDRISVQELEKQLKRREEIVTKREAQLAAREAFLKSAAAGAQPVNGQNPMSTVSKITAAPFNMARSVFRGKKKK
jgi:hypothetical protein